MNFINFDSVSFSYGNKIILKSFNLQLQENGLYLLTGHSGSGKTTLLRLISSLERPYSGIVKTSVPPSYAFQEYRLFPNLTVLENLAVVFREPLNKASLLHRNTIENLLTDLGLPLEVLSMLPCELSGGMKQRVAFARSILANKGILLLDEVTKELDLESRDKLLSVVSKESLHSIVIFSTHHIEECSNLAYHLIPFP